jgi:hypothetical protein
MLVLLGQLLLFLSVRALLAAAAAADAVADV